MTDNRAKPKPGPTVGTEDATVSKPRCGVVMPISSIDGCSDQHWGEVLAIISDAVAAVGFEAQLVSTTDAGVIHGAIVENLYKNPIVVCDVSAKNPNVMFELGMRLAFDKPTVVIKDDKTDYSFDTSPLAHLGYRRDLRFGDIVAFKEKLAHKVASVYRLAESKEPGYKSFLEHFGTYDVSKLNEHEATATQVLTRQINDLKLLVLGLQRPRSEPSDNGPLNTNALNSLGEHFANENLSEQDKSKISLVQFLIRKFPNMSIGSARRSVEVFLANYADLS